MAEQWQPTLGQCFLPALGQPMDNLPKQCCPTAGCQWFPSAGIQRWPMLRLRFCANWVVLLSTPYTRFASGTKVHSGKMTEIRASNHPQPRVGCKHKVRLTVHVQPVFLPTLRIHTPITGALLTRYFYL
jgi:hypothetical protein